MTLTPDQLPRPVAFVLGGGGSMGAMQVGMLRALDDLDIHPDIVVGTSVGAINGGVLATDPIGGVAQLEKLWESVDRKRMLGGGFFRRLWSFLRNRSYLFNGDGLAEMIIETVGERRIEDLPIPFAAMAVDVQTALPVVIQSGRLSTAVVASGAIPGVFPPANHEGQMLYDGGLVANVPVLQALALGAKSLVVLDCVFADQAAPDPTSLTKAMVYASIVSVRQQVLRDLPIAAQEVPVVYLPGAVPTFMSPLDFRKSARLIDESYEVSRDFLQSVSVDGPALYRAGTAAIEAPPVRALPRPPAV